MDAWNLFGGGAKTNLEPRFWTPGLGIKDQEKSEIVFVATLSWGALIFRMNSIS